MKPMHAEIGKRISKRILVGASVFAAACAHSYQLSHPLTTQESPRLKCGASAYIARPADGVFGSTVQTPSGQHTVTSLSAALRSRLARVEAAGRVESYQEALDSSRRNGHQYLVVPEIKHWEERATEWSGKPDRIMVRISIFGVVDAELIDAVDIEGKSRWLTFGGDHPQDLLPEPIEQYVSSLFVGC